MEWLKENKIGPFGTLTKDEEAKIVEYMVKMMKLAHPFKTNDLKLKVIEFY